MNVNFELYKLFYNVAKNKNITKTANELMISQPAISKAIKNLEDQLNCTLFIRNKTGVVLTEEGKVFYDEIKQAMEIINNAESKLLEMTNLEYGFLNIGVSNTLAKKYLLPYIEKFYKEYPNIKINIHTNMTTELIKKARNGIVDIIILNLPYNVPTDFDKFNLKTIHDCFIASSKFDYLKDKTIKLEELNNYPLILLAEGSNSRYFLDHFCMQKGIKLNPNFDVASFSLVVEFAKIGFGIAGVTREYILDELKNNELFELNIEPKLDSRNIGAIYLKSKAISRSSQKFLEMLKKAH